jgi:hypothetical protein
MMQVAVPFRHDYDVEVLTELPGDPTTEELLYFPHAGKVGGRDGVFIRISPLRRAPWIGCFAFGRAPRAATCVVACPNANEVCIVAMGAGYIVRADDPEQWWPTRSNPVQNVIPVPDHELLVLADFTTLVAYGPGGLKWESVRLSFDGLEDISVSGDRLMVTAWNAVTQEHKRIAVGIDDGHVLE